MDSAQMCFKARILKHFQYSFHPHKALIAASYHITEKHITVCQYQ